MPAVPARILVPTPPQGRAPGPSFESDTDMATIDFSDTIDRPALVVPASARAAGPGAAPVAPAPAPAPAAEVRRELPAAIAALLIPVTERDLTTLEWRVIELARTDGLATLRPERKRSWLARLVIGREAPSPRLADKRLEALRRLAVQGWHHGYTLPGAAIKEAIAAGYTEVQVGKAIDAIVIRRLGMGGTA
jgi:hypothetical protein